MKNKDDKSSGRCICLVADPVADKKNGLAFNVLINNVLFFI